MMKLVATLIWAVLTAYGTMATADQGTQKKVNVVFDLGPNGLRDAGVQARVSDLLVRDVLDQELALGDTARISSIGGTYMERLGSPDFNREFTFSYRGADPRDLPRGLAAQMALLPKEPTQSGPGGLQAFLAETDFGCASGAVHTVAVLNGAESLTIEGNRADYLELPEVKLCGTITFVGWWTKEHASAWPGMRQQVEAFTADLLIKMGAQDVRFVR